MKTILYLALFASIIYAIYQYKRETILKYIARIGYYVKVYVKKRNKAMKKAAKMRNSIPEIPEIDLGSELIDKIAEKKYRYYKKHGNCPSIVFMSTSEYDILKKSHSLKYWGFPKYDTENPIKYEGTVFGMNIKIVNTRMNCLEVGDESDFASFLRDTQGLN